MPYKDPEKERERSRRRRVKDPAGWNKKCNDSRKRTRAANPEAARKKEREKTLAYRKAHRKEMREYGKRRYAREREKFRADRLKRKFGMSPEEYAELLSDQGGTCKICGALPGKGRRLAVDHAHDEHGRVRGLLCTRCNPGIGYFRDSPALLRKAAEYLEKSCDE